MTRADPTTDPWARTLAGRPTPGATARRSRRTGMRDVEAFTAMTGDRNPLHYDAGWRRGRPSAG